MFKLILDLIPGAALVFAAYVLYLAFTKGIPYTVGWLKTKFTASKAALAQAKADVATAHARIDAVEADVKAIKAKVGV